MEAENASLENVVPLETARGRDSRRRTRRNTKRRQRSITFLLSLRMKISLHTHTHTRARKSSRSGRAGNRNPRKQIPCLYPLVEITRALPVTIHPRYIAEELRREEERGETVEGLKTRRRVGEIEAEGGNRWRTLLGNNRETSRDDTWR